MAETRLKINSQLEKSVTPGSITVTNAINEQIYLVPGIDGQILSISSGLPTYIDTLSSLTVQNGITGTLPNIVELGGSLIQDTIIDGVNTYSMFFNRINDFTIDVGGSIQLARGSIQLVNGINLTAINDNTNITSSTSLNLTTPNVYNSLATTGQVLTLMNDVSGNVEFQNLPLPTIKIPTPRIWAKNGSSSGTSSTDVTTLSATGWAIPSIYAQQFSRDTDTWRSLNPVYELLVHKKVGKAYSRYVLSSMKWVHPVNQNTITAGKKYASGFTYNSATSLPWQDRRTEWEVGISTVPTQLVDINPHDFVSYNSNDTNSGGVNPILGAYKIDDFKNSFWFPPKRGRSKGNIKMAFSVRIRIDNPDFQAGVPNQEPYLYGEPSNVLVFKPQVTNMWDGTTLDSLGNRVAELYCFNWIASEENINN